MDKILIIIDNMEFEEKHLLSIRQQEANKIIKSANFTTSTGAILTILVIGFIALFIKFETAHYIAKRKWITRKIKSSEKMFRNPYGVSL